MQWAWEKQKFWKKCPIYQQNIWNSKAVECEKFENYYPMKYQNTSKKQYKNGGGCLEMPIAKSSFNR